MIRPSADPHPQTRRFCPAPGRCVGALAALAILLASALGPAQAQEPASYTISPGDALQLVFLDDDAEPYPLVVSGRGDVQLPFLGSVPVAGEDLAGAHASIVARYKEQGIFVEPQLALSIVSLRPFSVIGDVQTPGFFDYRTDITVEQAVGLAGGPRQDLGGEEARSLQRVALHGELLASDSALIRVAVTAARLRAQLADADSFAVTDVTMLDVTQPDNALLTALVEQENAIIAAERAHNAEDRDLVARAIEEAKTQISLIQDQMTAQAEQIKSYDAELASSESLTDRGLVTAPQRARLLRQVADEHTALLRLETTLAATRRDLTGLERELIGLEFRRMQGWRESLAETDIEAARLRAAQASIQERIELLEDWSRRTADVERGVRVTYVLRRREADGSYRTIDVTETDIVLPGDVVIVRQERYRAARTNALLGAPAEDSALQ